MVFLLCDILACFLSSFIEGGPSAYKKIIAYSKRDCNIFFVLSWPKNKMYGDFVEGEKKKVEAEESASA